MWRRCVLPFGVCVLPALGVAIQYLFHRASLTGFEAHPEFNWGISIAVNVVGGPIGGYLTGIWIWRSNEADYLRGDQIDAA